MKKTVSHWKPISSYFVLVYLACHNKISWAFQMAQWVKNTPTKAGVVRDGGSISGSGRSPRGGPGNPLQNSCLENLMDRGDWLGYSP